MNCCFTGLAHTQIYSAYDERDRGKDASGPLFSILLPPGAPAEDAPDQGTPAAQDAPEGAEEAE